mmetsp:Transcript_2/g.6  ORF Transcript_2/g.6 Transcript_2/m.6 type:complete len:253 (-) Transcript_2:269-1027(-)
MNGNVLPFLVAAFTTFTCAEKDVPGLLRDALVSETTFGVNGGNSPSHFLFDAERLHRSFPDPLGRRAEQRFAGFYIIHGKQKLVEPFSLLDLAFGQGKVQHSPEQQSLQTWLFSLCNRLPRSAGEGPGLRRQCVESLATFAAASERVKSNFEVSSAGNLDLNKRRQLSMVLGLQLRGTYLESRVTTAADEDEELQQARAAVNADAELQLLLRDPVVARALVDVAANPKMIAEYAENPKIADALERLNAHIQS